VDATASYDSNFMLYTARSSEYSAARIVSILHSALNVKSVLDVGCATGTWLKAWERAGVRDIHGVDGEYVSVEQLQIDQGHFTAVDLTNPLTIDRQFDLVQSLEVAEHIPTRSSEQFVRNLVRHASRYILFSAAVPGQGGENHVNEQEYEFWRNQFSSHGYVAYDFVRPKILADSRISYWYRYNTLLFVRREMTDTIPASVLSTLIPAGQRVSDVSPTWFKLRRSLVQWLPADFQNHLAKLKSRIATAGLPIQPSVSVTDTAQDANRSNGSAYLTVIVSVTAVALLSYLVSALGGYLTSTPSAERHRATEMVVDLQAMAAMIPRLPSGEILRQGDLPTDWLAKTGTLPARSQSLAASVRVPNSSIPVGAVTVDSWGRILDVEAGGTALNVRFSNLLQSECLALMAAARSAPSIGYVTSGGDPWASFSTIQPDWTCRSKVGTLATMLIDPAVEFRRLADTLNRIRHETGNAPAKSGAVNLTGAYNAAPLSVDVKHSTDGIAVQLGNVAGGICARMLVAGPGATGATQYIVAGTTAEKPQTADIASSLCLSSSGRVGVQMKPD
jgi:SAM-dependent methyltransferase